MLTTAYVERDVADMEPHLGRCYHQSQFRASRCAHGYGAGCPRPLQQVHAIQPEGRGMAQPGSICAFVSIFLWSISPFIHAFKCRPLRQCILLVQVGQWMLTTSKLPEYDKPLSDANSFQTTGTVTHACCIMPYSISSATSSQWMT